MDGLNDLADVVGKIIDQQGITNSEYNRHILALYQHCKMQGSAMLEYKAAILELQRQVEELQSNAADKILLVNDARKD